MVSSSNNQFSEVWTFKIQTIPGTSMIPWSKRHATTFAINVCTQLRRRRFLNCNWRSLWNDTKLFDTSAICVEVTDTSSTEKLSPSRSMFAQEFLVHLQEKLETSQVKPSQATALAFGVGTIVADCLHAMTLV